MHTFEHIYLITQNLRVTLDPHGWCKATLLVLRVVLVLRVATRYMRFYYFFAHYFIGVGNNVKLELSC